MKCAWLVCGVLVAGCYEAEPLAVADDVDLERLEGRWYEIAKLPRPSQRDCSQTIVTYEQRSPDEFRMVTECHSPTATNGVARAEAKLVLPDRAEPAKLALDFGFYIGEHWIVEVGPEYEFFVVGHPTRQFLWILSREHTIDPQTLTRVVEHARAQNFPTENLEYTRH